MSKLDLQCPKCGASMKVDFENLQAGCPYCGYKDLLNIDLDKAVLEKEKTKRIETKYREETKQKQAEIESKKESSRLNFWDHYLLLLFLVIIPLVLIIGYFGYEPYHRSKGEVEIPISSEEIKKEHYSYDELMTLFSKNGFSNVKTKKIEDIKLGILKKDGEVERVTIDGASSFSKGEWVSQDAEIVITYHTKKGN